MEVAGWWSEVDTNVVNVLYIVQEPLSPSGLSVVGAGSVKLLIESGTALIDINYLPAKQTSDQLTPT